jgi:hypothetical protein
MHQTIVEKSQDLCHKCQPNMAVNLLCARLVATYLWCNFLVNYVTHTSHWSLRKMYLNELFRRNKKNDKKARDSREYCTSEYIYILFCWFSQALPIGHITEVRAELFERLSDFQTKCSDKNLRKQFPRNGLIFFLKLNQNN